MVVAVLGAVLLLALVLPAALRGGAPAARGQSQRGDSARSGVVTDVAPAAPVGIAWEQTTSVPVVVPDWLVAGPELTTVAIGASLEVLDTTTGQLRRQVDLATTAGLDRARPFGDLLVIPGATAEDDATGVDLATGEVRWVAPLADNDLATAIGLQGDVIAPERNRQVHRVRGTDGHRVWSTDLSQRLNGAGVLRLVNATPNRVLAVTVNPADAVPQPGAAGVEVGLAGIDAASGSVAWTSNLGVENAFAPIAMTARSTAGDGWLVHRSVSPGQEPLLVVRRLGSGQPVAEIPFAGNLLGLAVVADVVVVSATLSGVAGHDAASGRLLWTSDRLPGRLATGDDEVVVVLRAPGSGAVTIIGLDGGILADITDVQGDFPVSVAAGIVTIATDAGALAGRDVTGSRLWQRNLSAMDLASIATDGRLVAVNGQGGTVVLDGRNGRAVSSVARRVTPGGRGVAGSVVINDGSVVAVPIGPPETGLGLTGMVATSAVSRWNLDGDQPAVTGPLTLADDLAFLPVGVEIRGYDLVTGRRAFAEHAGIRRGPIAVAGDTLIAAAAAATCAGLESCPNAIIAIARRRAVGITQGPREVRWTSTVPACGPPAARDGTVLVPTASGPAALELATGATRWHANEQGSCAPLAVGPQHAVQAVGTTIRAWSLDDGVVAWSVELGQTPTTQPVIAGNEVVVGTLDSDLLALDLDSGQIRWRHRLPVAALADPIVVDGHWVVLLRDGRVVGLR